MKNVPQNVLSAIEQASTQSGVDFSYLVQQAKAESSFNPSAQAKTSSATGLYQFIDSTWLQMVERYGTEYGLETEGKTDAEILQMRKDPKASSFMAAAFASENEKFLAQHWGGDTGSTELYFAHFLGASGAASFLNARDENPLRPAADLFPRAARANYNVFYDSKTGQPRSLEQVYQFFDQKFNAAPKTDLTYIAEAPLPRDKPAAEHLAAQEVRNTISDHAIMQKAKAMREATKQSGHGQLSGLDFILSQRLQVMQDSLTDTQQQRRTMNTIANSNAKTPFFSLVARPVDLMLLTQNATETTTPRKVVRDKS